MSGQDRSRSVADPASNRESNDSTLGRRLHRFLVPGSQARAADQSGSAEARTGARGTGAEPARRRDHHVRGVDALRLRPRHLVRLLDWLRRGGLSLRPPHDDRLARGDLPLDLRPDLSESRRRQAPGDCRSAVADGSGEDEQNVELLDLSRQILTLTKEVHLIARPLADSSGGGSRSSGPDRSGN
jgi:hypothetical protein